MNRRQALPACAGALLLLAFAGCDNMQHQENVRAFEPSDHFADGASARVPPAHTVARGSDAPAGASGHGAGAMDFPVRLDRQLLLRGMQRYAIFCADCHGDDGYGGGIVVLRGFPRPPSFHDARLRTETPAGLFEAISRGYGVMYGFQDRIDERDRWAIAAYVRALQKSQHASVAELSADERRRLPQP